VKAATKGTEAQPEELKPEAKKAEEQAKEEPKDKK